MPQKPIPPTSSVTKVELARTLFRSGLDVHSVAVEMGCPPSMVYLFRNGYNTYSEYQKHLRRELGLPSYHQRVSRRSVSRKNEESRKKRAERLGFHSTIAYLDYLAQKSGFASYSERKEACARKKGFRSGEEYNYYRQNPLAFVVLVLYGHPESTVKATTEFLRQYFPRADQKIVKECMDLFPDWFKRLPSGQIRLEVEDPALKAFMEELKGVRLFSNLFSSGTAAVQV